MKQHQLGAMEARFAELIWQHAPLSSGALVKLCAAELEWKKSTTYTMLRRLCERGMFENKDGLVQTVISKEAFAAMQSERFVEEAFDGSLPAFLAAFTTRKRLSAAEIEELEGLIRAQKGDA